MASDKKRPTPARDRARAALKKLRGVAIRSRWSPKRLRKELRHRRNACERVWRAVVREIFGPEMTDLRQMPLFK